MINKQNLWFLTLFSLILVLSVYYITMPNELLLTNNNAKISTNEKSSNTSSKKTDSKTTNDTTTKKDSAVVSIKESEVLTALRVNLDEERTSAKKKLEALLTNGKITTEEKNNAYNKLQQLNKLSGQESTIEAKIKEKFKLPAFVKIDNKEITVVIDNDKHDTTLANNIMRSVQEEFNEKMYITVQFK